MSVRIGGLATQQYHRQREAEALRSHAVNCHCWDCVWARAVTDALVANTENHDPGDEDRA